MPDPGPPASSLWHVTLTVAGSRRAGSQVRAALVRLAHERPFLHAGRYASDRAEIRYWEEAASLADAASLALRLWPEHRVSAELPAWEVVGLEVLHRDTYYRRRLEGPVRARSRAVLVGSSEIRPF